MPDERTCPVCHGMRFIVPAVLKVGDPGFGRAIPCPEGCDRANQQRHLNRLSGLTTDQQQHHFGVAWQLPIAPVAEELRGMLDEVPPRGIALLAGGYGIGKTHLLCASVNHAIKQNWTAVYTSAEELLDHFRRAYAPDAKFNYDGLFDRVKNARVLCLDEIDRINPTPWAESQLFKLLNSRYEASVYGGQDAQLTIMATNRRPADLDGYLLSRLRDSGGRIYEMWEARDFRALRGAIQR